MQAEALAFQVRKNQLTATVMQKSTAIHRKQRIRVPRRMARWKLWTQADGQCQACATLHGISHGQAMG